METLYILPRQSGKTTTAILEFLKTPEYTLFITFDIKRCKRVINQYSLQKFKHNFYSFKQINDIHKINDKWLYKIIIDEYFFMNDKQMKELYDLYYSNKFREVTCYTSVKKKYSKKLIEEIKQQKESVLPDSSPLCYNFITENSFKIISLKPEMFGNLVPRLSKLKKLLGKEAYDMEINNNYLN